MNEIDLFTTTLDTPDNRRLIVPNSSIAGSTIENVTFHTQRRVDVNVGVEYRADLNQTREVLTQAAEALRPLLIDGEGRGYQILLANLSTSSVDWTIRFWTATSNVFKVRESLTKKSNRAWMRPVSEFRSHSCNYTFLKTLPRQRLRSVSFRHAFALACVIRKRMWVEPRVVS